MNVVGVMVPGIDVAVFLSCFQIQSTCSLLASDAATPAKATRGKKGQLGMSSLKD